MKPIFLFLIFGLYLLFFDSLVALSPKQNCQIYKGRDYACLFSVISGTMSKTRATQWLRVLLAYLMAVCFFEIQDFTRAKDPKLVKRFNIRVNKNWQSVVRVSYLEGTYLRIPHPVS